MRVLDLFAGIGGFTIGLERAGFETVAFCEIEPYPQQVLRKHWPGVPIYDDVRDITADRLISDGIRVDVITGGFPCQDLSISGNQAGIEGERSGLWTECARLLRELQPRYAIFENVTNLLVGDGGDWFKRVLWDISQVGYDAEWHCIPASELGAHHHRDRVWIVAYPKSAGSEACSPDGVGNEHGSRGYAGQSSGTGEQKTVLLEDSRYRRWRDAEGNTRGQDASREWTADTGTIVRSSEDVADASRKRVQGGRSTEQQEPQAHVGEAISLCGGPGEGGSYWLTEPDVGRVDNGVPARPHRLKCLGNAVVPPIPQIIGEAIMNVANAT